MAGAAKLFRLHSIKSKIIAFSILATLIPSLTMGWLSYRNNRLVLQEKIDQQLGAVSGRTAREFDGWFEERRRETKVFSSSYELSDNLEKLTSPGDDDGLSRLAVGRLQDYLSSVAEKFDDYLELTVVDLEGAVVASSIEQAGQLRLADDWLVRALDGEPMIGPPYWDEGSGAAAMSIAEPVRGTDQRLQGVLTAKLSFRGIEKILLDNTTESSGALWLIDRRGRVLTAGADHDAGFLETGLPFDVTQRLFDDRSRSSDLILPRGPEVVGRAHGVEVLEWAILATEQKATAYRRIDALRNQTILIIASVLLVIGLAAYALGLTIVRPLDRLTKGAAAVSLGDLEVDLPVPGPGELGYLTEVFNHMVMHLRQIQGASDSSHEQLIEQNRELLDLSITDGLTGLHNRSHMAHALEQELERARRHRHPFSIMMIDLDHFKEYNDTHGHQAGDEVLRRAADVFRRCCREIDYIARYGGEEFLILLPETEAEGGAEMGERIRVEMEQERFLGSPDPVRLTISVGVAAYPDNGDTIERLIRKADSALYDAKGGSRNRVVLASGTLAEHSIGESVTICDEAG